jgi:hypothetical protein
MRTNFEVIEEKAKELVDVYLDITKRSIDDKGFFYDIDLAKQCALILVNEFIFQINREESKWFWTKVKQEIERL